MKDVRENEVRGRQPGAATAHADILNRNEGASDQNNLLAGVLGRFFAARQTASIELSGPKPFNARPLPGTNPDVSFLAAFRHTPIL